MIFLLWFYVVWLLMFVAHTSSIFLFASIMSLVAWTVKCLPTMQETQVRSLGRENPLEKEMATHSSIHAWKIPWTEEPGRLQSTGSQRVGHDWATSVHFTLRHVPTSFLSQLWVHEPSPSEPPGKLSLWSIPYRPPQPFCPFLSTLYLPSKFPNLFKPSSLSTLCLHPSSWTWMK